MGVRAKAHTHAVINDGNAACAQTVVLGVSHDMGCIESLEKRVKSRFSGQSIMFTQPACADATCRILNAALSIPPSALAALASAPSRTGTTAGVVPAAAAGTFAAAWNERVQALLADAGMHAAMEPMLGTSTDCASLQAWAREAVRLFSLPCCLLCVHTRQCAGEWTEGQRQTQAERLTQ